MENRNLLNRRDSIFATKIEDVRTREGIEVEKGSVLTIEYV